MKRNRGIPCEKGGKESDGSRYLSACALCYIKYESRFAVQPKAYRDVPFRLSDFMFEKKNSPSDWRAIFKNNAMMAGGLETFMLIFVGMSRNGLMPADAFSEIALGMRPLFYGFICYAVLRDGEGRRVGEGQKERKAAGDKTQGAAAGGVQRAEGDEALREEGETLKEAEAVPKHDFSSLTRQEKCVAELIARGLTNREIGEELCISETTVKKHVSNIFEKLGISSRKELR